MSYGNKIWNVLQEDCLKVRRPIGELLPLQRKMTRYRKHKQIVLQQLRVTKGGETAVSWEVIDEEIRKLRKKSGYESEIEDAKECEEQMSRKGKKGREKERILEKEVNNKKVVVNVCGMNITKNHSSITF